MTELLPTPTEQELLLPEGHIEPAQPTPVLADYVAPQASRIGSGDSRALITLVGLVTVFILAGGTTFVVLNGTTAHLAHQSLPAETAAAVASTSTENPFASVRLQAQSAYVYDMQTQQVLYTLNPDAERPMASLTKIAMALAVSEVLPLDSTITIPYDTAPVSSAEVLTKGSVWTVRDVLNFTLIASSNQGADILGRAANDPLHVKYPLSPQSGTTVWRMNKLVRDLGLTDMLFSNDSGLDLSSTESGAYGSARDVGTLVAYAASTSLDLFTETTQNTMTFKNAAGMTATAYNTDTALGAIPGIVMGKTGYTDLAGGNLAVVFDAAGIGHPVVAVVMGSTIDGRFSDMKQLVDASRIAVAAGQ
ncbi:MAG TPA: serine hydrolase [Candidatus Paceibacterota bacterium]|nr:serine hydrolase [Candidatus Paceibacterota bacterium]